MSKINGILMLLISICVVTACLNETFIENDNLGNVVKRTALFGIISIGVAFVIITGGIDLSIGSLIGLVGCVLAILLTVKYEYIDQADLLSTESGSSRIEIDIGESEYRAQDLVAVYDGKVANQGIYEVTSEPEAVSSNDSDVNRVAMQFSESLSENDRQGKILRVHPIVEASPLEMEVVLADTSIEIAPKDKVVLFEEEFDRVREVAVVDVLQRDGRIVLKLDEYPGGDFASGHLGVVRRRANSIAASVALVMLMSLGIGLVHGLLITKVQLQPFVVTLCGLLIYRGVARTITSDQSVGFANEYDDSLRMLALGTPCSVATLFMIGGACLMVWGIVSVLLAKRASSSSDEPVAAADDASRDRMIRLIGMIAAGVLLAVIGSSRFWFGVELDERLANKPPLALFGMTFDLWPYTVPEKGAELPAQLMRGIGWLFAPAALVWCALCIRRDPGKMIKVLGIFVASSVVLGLGLAARGYLGDASGGMTIAKLLRILIVLFSVGQFFGSLALLARAGVACGGRWAKLLGLMVAALSILWLVGHTELTMTMVPAPFFVFLLVAVVAALFMTQTIFGRYLLALGRNEQAARFSGIKTDRMVILSYVICSGCAGLGGVLFALDLNSVQPAQQGNFYELYAIAAAVLGGCSLRGGEGTILGVVIGAAVMRVLRNSIFLVGIPDQLEFAIIGVVILIGVIVDEVVRRVSLRQRAKFESEVAQEPVAQKPNAPPTG